MVATAVCDARLGHARAAEHARRSRSFVLSADLRSHRL